MKVYRVEAKDGYGMYSSDQDVAYVFRTSKVSPRHPMAERDDALVKAGWHVKEWNWGALGRWYSPVCPAGHEFHADGGWAATKADDGTRFAFASLEQLKNWIYRDAWRQRLQERGYHIKVYETQDAIGGDTQAVFNALADDIKVVETLDIVTLEPVEAKA